MRSSAAGEKRQAEVRVDAAHRADRIAQQVHVAHVEEAVGGDQPVVARLAARARARRPSGASSRDPTCVGIDVVAERAAQRRT